MSNVLLKILIVVAVILAGLVYYSNKIIHEKPIHEEESVVVKNVVMPHPPLSDKSNKIEEEKVVKEDTQIDSNKSEEFVNVDGLDSDSIELTPDIPKAEVEIIADEPEVVINDETEVIDESVVEEVLSVEEPSLVSSDEVEIIENIPQEQIPIKKPKIDLGTRIGGYEEKKENVDLGVQLF